MHWQATLALLTFILGGRPIPLLLARHSLGFQLRWSHTPNHVAPRRRLRALRLYPDVGFLSKSATWSSTQVTSSFNCPRYL
ncbi:hypothetical protein FB451DRAFT_107077 [Mycena latifolia]|nr:hypothetical protein FB451DRAFT_107077 [Mycena latifolia]